MIIVDELSEFISSEVARGRNYHLVVLQKGPRDRSDKELLAQFQTAHLEHIFGLRREGKLVLSGPCLIDSRLRGICIFNLSDTLEVKQLVEADPMVQAGFLVGEIYPWMGLPGDALPQ